MSSAEYTPVYSSLVSLLAMLAPGPAGTFMDLSSDETRGEEATARFVDQVSHHVFHHLEKAYWWKWSKKKKVCFKLKVILLQAVSPPAEVKRSASPV